MRDGAEVRLMRGPFSGDWLAAILDPDGRTVVQKWRFSDEDQAKLNRAFPLTDDEDAEVTDDSMPYGPGHYTGCGQFVGSDELAMVAHMERCVTCAPDTEGEPRG